MSLTFAARWGPSFSSFSAILVFFDFLLQRQSAPARVA